MDNYTLTGWVKAEKLAEFTGLSVRAVRRQIAANVKAGWLEVVERGNSSGWANTYRLTYPKGDTYVTLPPSAKGDTNVTLDLEGCHIRPGKGDTDVTPTSPRTSPKRSSLTSPEKGDTYVTLPTEKEIPADPFAGSGVGDLFFPSTPPDAQLKGDVYVTLPHDPKGDADVTLPDRAGLRDTGPQPGEPGFDPFADWQPAV